MKVVVLGSALALFAAGCGGTKASNVPPSINGIQPPEAFLGRDTTLIISGDATDFTAAAPPTVAISGTGVTVGTVTVASRTALQVPITVADIADVGSRTVTVTDHGHVLTYTAFATISPVEVTSVVGTQAQGAYLAVHVVNLDDAHPFDTTFNNLVYPNLSLTSPAGTTGGIVAVHEFSLDLQFLIDVTAQATTAATFTIHSGPPAGTQTSFVAPGAFRIDARTPQATLGASPLTGTFGTAGDTQLLQLDAAAGEMFSVSSTSGAFVAVLGSAGTFSSGIHRSGDALYSRGAGTFYVAVIDLSAQGGSWTVTPRRNPTVEGSESEQNNAFGTANAIAPTISTGAMMLAALSSGSDEDWFSIAAVPSGSHVHVWTESIASGPTDTVVDVVLANGTTVLATSADNQVDENVDAGPVPSTQNIFVRVYPSAGFYNPLYQGYVVMVLLD